MLRRYEARKNIYLNSTLDGDAVCEVTSVEITFEGTDGKDEFSTLDLGTDLGLGDGSNVDLR